MTWSTNANSATIPQYSDSDSTSHDPTDKPKSQETCHKSLHTFLALCQRLEVDFLPFTWQPEATLLGSGGTALVSQAMMERDVGFAFKRFDVSKDSQPLDEANIYQALISEVSILKHPAVQNHPNVVNLEGICWEVDATCLGTPKVWPVLVFDMAQHGSLAQYVSKNKPSLETSLNILYDILETMGYMHTSDLIHGDIKPGNVLIFSGGEEGVTAKFTDFGYSTLGAKAGIILPVSEGWSAPEVTDPPESTNGDKHFTFAQAVKADIFSLGLVALWILCSPDKYDAGEASDVSGMPPKSPWAVLVQKLRREDTFLPFTSTVIDSYREIDNSLKDALHRFFKLSLVVDPKHRALDCSVLLQALSRPSFQENAVGANLEEIQVEATQSCPELDASLLVFHLRRLGYRIRNHVILSFQQMLHSSWCDCCSKMAAFQLAVLNSIGFGTPANAKEAARFLEKSERTSSELETKKRQIVIGEMEHVPFNDRFAEREERGSYPGIDVGIDYHRAQDSADLVKILEAEASDLEQSLGADHTVVFSMKSALSELFRRRSEHSKSESILKQLIAGLEDDQLYGSNHRVTLHMRKDLASLYQDMSEPERGIPIQEDVVKRLEANSKEDQPFLLDNMQVLAGLYADAFRLEEAGSCIRKVLEIKGRTYGNESLHLCRDLTQFGLILDRQGQYAEAKGNLQRAVSIYRKTLGEHHLDALSASSLLVGTYIHDGDIDEAEKTIREVHRTEMVYLDQRGVRSPEYVVVLMYRAEICGRKGQIFEALDFSSEAKKYAAEFLGDESPLFLQACECEITAKKHQGVSVELVELQKKVIAVSEQVDGKDHPYTFVRKFVLGELLILCHQLEDAEQTLRQALDGSEGIEGVSDDDRNRCFHHLGHIYELRNERMASVDYYARALEMSRRVYCQGHDEIELDEDKLLEAIEDMTRFADEKYDHNVHEEAEALYRKACEVRCHFFGMRNTSTIAAMRNLALFIWSTGKQDGTGLVEVARIEEKVLDSSIEVFGDLHPDTREAAMHLVATYKDQGRHEDAKRVECRFQSFFKDPLPHRRFSRAGKFSRAKGFTKRQAHIHQRRDAP